MPEPKPIENAGQNFIDWYRELYGDVFLPEMESTDWSSVASKCNKDEKPLMLYINNRTDPNPDADLLLVNDAF